MEHEQEQKAAVLKLNFVCQKAWPASCGQAGLRGSQIQGRDSRDRLLSSLVVLLGHAFQNERCSGPAVAPGQEEPGLEALASPGR